MGIKRVLDVNFWDEEDIYDFTEKEKLFYLYLLTNSKTSEIGVYTFNIAKAEIETKFDRAEIEKLLKIFMNKGKIYYSEKTNEILLKNWMKYNYPNTLKKVKELNKDILRIKDEDIRCELYNIVKKYAGNEEILFKGTNYVEEKTKVKNIRKVKNKDVKKNIKTESEEKEIEIIEIKENLTNESNLNKLLYKDVEYKETNVENKIEEKEDVNEKRLEYVIEFYTKYIHEPNQYEIKRLTNWCKHMEYKAVILAIMEALKYGVINIDYMSKIINKWYKMGYRTRTEVAMYLEK